MSSLDDSDCEIIEFVPSKLRNSESKPKSNTTIIILDNSTSSDKTPPKTNQEFRFKPYIGLPETTSNVEINKKKSPNLKISVNQKTPARKIDVFKSPGGSRKKFKKSFRTDKAVHSSLIGQSAIETRRNKKKNKKRKSLNKSNSPAKQKANLRDAVDVALNLIRNQTSSGFAEAKAYDPSYPAHLINPPVQTNQTTNINNNMALNGICNQFKRSLSINLRFVVIDGSNVAIEHGKQITNRKVFSCKGLEIAVKFFLNRGHKDIRVMVPRFRRGRSDKECNTLNPEILDRLESQGYLCYTPSRFVNNKLILPYDDRFILKTATHFNAIIVSNDNYRDLWIENQQWKRLVETSLLQFSFVGDLFLIADDPLGKNGPSIDEFLSKN